MTRIEFIPLSGAGKVDANAYLLRVAPSANASFEPVELLLDCGATGEGLGPEASWLEALERAPQLVWVSHVHSDHVGGLPELCERYVRVPLVATPASAQLAPFALRHSSGARWSGAAYQQRLEAVARSIRPLPFRRTRALAELVAGWAGPDIRLTAYEAGHLLGAAMLLVEIERDGQRPYRLLYSGDFCTHDQPLVGGALLPVPSDDFAIDVFVCEGVLATDREADDVDYDREIARLEAALTGQGDAVPGPRLLAVSSLGEAAEVAQAVLDAGLEVLVHEYLEPVIEAYRRAYPARLGAAAVRYGSEAQCRGALRAGGVVIAPGEQLEPNSAAGKLVFEVLDDKSALVAIFNRAHAQTPAGAMLAAAAGKAVRARKRTYRRRCRLERFVLPTHAPRWQIIETVRALDVPRVLLVHGHEKRLHALSRAIRRAVPGVNVEVAMHRVASVLWEDEEGASDNGELNPGTDGED